MKSLSPFFAFILRPIAFSLASLLLASTVCSQTTNAPPKELAEAAKLLSDKRPAAAIRILEGLEAQYKEGDLAIQILVKLHDAYTQAKRTKDADRVVQKIITQFPGQPFSEQFLWSAIEKEGNPAQQTKLARDYLKLFPKGPHLAEVTKRLSATDVETAWKKSPQELHQAAEDLYNNRQFEEALKLYEQLQKSAADKDFASLRIGFCHWWMHNYEEAVQVWTQLADKMPQSKYAPEALQMAGRTYTGPLHDGGRALSLFQRIVKDYPKSNEAEPAAYSIAILNYWMKRNEAARNAFEDFIKTYPNSVYVPAAEKLLSELQK